MAKKARDARELRIERDRSTEMPLCVVPVAAVEEAAERQRPMRICEIRIEGDGALGGGLCAREAFAAAGSGRSTTCSRSCRRGRHRPARRSGRARSHARSARAPCRKPSGDQAVEEVAPAQVLLVAPRDQRSRASAASSSARRSASAAALRRSATRCPAGRSAARCSSQPELLAPELRLGRRVDELRLDRQVVRPAG